MVTFYEALGEAYDILKAAQITDWEYDSKRLMQEVLNMTSTDMLLRKKDIMDEADYNHYMEAVAKRALRIPLQYITGHGYFMGYEFLVNEHVLIPRYDTECLVEECIKLLKGMTYTPRVLDMCTGSGCIGISIELMSHARVTCADISDEAIKVAKSNALKHNSDVNIIKSDLFENIQEEYDLIVSNPPYITTLEITTLEDEVKKHEPYIALWGHDDGLYFYREITRLAYSHLKKGGYLCYEIGCSQGLDVVKLLEDNGYKNCRILKDLAGLDRIVTGMK